MSDDLDPSEYLEAGFVVLRAAFDPTALAREVAAALQDGYRGAPPVGGTVGNRFRYVPMMCEKTPVSLSLLGQLAPTAARLLDRQVLPVRAKGTQYFGGTGWHCDSDLEVDSIGLAAYLEPLEAVNGALRVIPGSHRLAAGGEPTALPDGSASGALALATEPGDIIAFDEHLWHSSSGGSDRRQWRVDFVAVPATPVEARDIGVYFDGVFPPGWDGGYDVDRYPSYGEEWLSSQGPWADQLRELGAYGRAQDQEAAVRTRRRSEA